MGVGGAGYFGYQYIVKESKQMTVNMVNALANDDFTQAKQIADISDEDATALAAKFKAYGKCKDVSITNYSSTTINGRKAVSVDGSLFFDTAGSKSFHAAFSNETGKLKIEELSVD
ncbi:MAG: hypothetical protein QM754_04090 [Tepidisphaeraceae bacterium]